MNNHTRLHWAIIIRKRLLIKGLWKWNSIVRDVSAIIENKFKKTNQNKLRENE